MSTASHAAFKKQLLEQRAAVMAQLSALRGGDIGRVQASAEHFTETQDSRAQVNTERELEFALDEHESAELAAINAALSRIEAGSYGQCTDCGVQIPQARLHAAPEAPRCIACQTQLESRHGGEAG